MTPHWPDACAHNGPDDRFLGTTVNPDTGEKLDVYLYRDHAPWPTDPGIHVCIRYGGDGPDYYSPGEVGRFLARGPVMPAYANPIEMIRKHLEEAA